MRLICAGRITWSAIYAWRLPAPADNAHVVATLTVSVTIGAYSIIDSYGSRHMGGNLYPLLLFIGTGITLSIYGIATGRRHDMRAALSLNWKHFCVAGIVVAGLGVLIVGR